MNWAGLVSLAGGHSPILFQRPEISDDLANFLFRKLLPEGHHHLIALVIDDTFLDRLGNVLVGHFCLSLLRGEVRDSKDFPHSRVARTGRTMTDPAMLQKQLLSSSLDHSRKCQRSSKREYQSKDFAHDPKNDPPWVNVKIECADS